MLFAGYLVTDVLDKMIQLKNKQLKPARKLFIYSGHDVTLVNVMRALDIISQTSSKPDFASALHFELHHNPLAFDNDSEVKVIKQNLCDAQKNEMFLIRFFFLQQIYYSFNHDSELKPIKIPNCDAPCSLTNFSKSVQSIIIRDYEQTCTI